MGDSKLFIDISKSNLMKPITFFFLILSFVGLGCKKKNDANPEVETETFPEKTNPNLIYFGYTLIDVFWDDPSDGVTKTNYIDEVAPFSNIADILVISPTDDIRERLTIMESYGVKGVLHLNELFFEYVGSTPGMSGANYDLRPDYMERWDTFVSLNEFDLNTSNLGVFYLGEEPTWNSISAIDFKTASDYIKATIPEIPILLVEAYPAIDALEIPSSVDWVSFDHYFIKDPTTNAEFQTELATLKGKLFAHQNLALVMDAHYLSFAHGAYGIALEDMGIVARNYYNLANSETDVVALIGYHWPSGFDFSEAIGSRAFPDSILNEHRSIGRAITGK